MRFLPTFIVALLLATQVHAFEAKTKVEADGTPTNIAEVLAEVSKTGEKFAYITDPEKIKIWDTLAALKAGMGPIPGVAIIVSLENVEVDVNGVPAYRVFVVMENGELRYNKLFEKTMLEEMISAINGGDA